MKTTFDFKSHFSDFLVRNPAFSMLSAAGRVLVEMERLAIEYDYRLRVLRNNLNTVLETAKSIENSLDMGRPANSLGDIRGVDSVQVSIARLDEIHNAMLAMARIAKTFAEFDEAFFAPFPVKIG